MGRRTSGATVGIEKIGLVQASANTLTTSQPNQNLIMDPNGTGITQVERAMTVIGNGTTGGEVRLGDADGTHWTTLRTAASTTANRTLTFPDSNGLANQVLQTDGSGNLTWVAQTTAGVTASDPGASATQHYLFFGTNSGSIVTGQVTAFNNKSNLIFVPSTGELTSTSVNAANMYGSTATSGTLTLRGTTSGTKNTASVQMTDNVGSSSTATGTLVVTGGVGISQNVNIGGTIGVAQAATFSTTVGVTGVLSANGGTSGIIGYTPQTASTTLGDSDRFYIVANSGAITLTLPATATNGRTIVLADGNNFQTNNVTLGRNGRTIGGLAEDLVLNVRNSRVELVYYGGDWKVFVY